jgi:MFS family permease
LTNNVQYNTNVKGHVLVRKYYHRHSFPLSPTNVNHYRFASLLFTMSIYANEAHTESLETSGSPSPDDTTNTSAEKTSTEANARLEHRTIRGLRWLLICLALYTTCFLYGLDTTIAADVQGPVIERFGEIEKLAWIGAGFPLGSVCVILPLGNIYNNFDIKWTFFISVLLFEVGSALCGAAPTMNALIVGRVLAGMGGSGIYLGALNYCLYMTTPAERGLYMAAIGTCWGIGAVLGPVIGGAFAVSSATWRWAFYINLVFFAVMAPAYIFCLPSIRPVQGLSVRARLARLDFMGYLLGAGVWVAFLLVMTMAGAQWPWNDGRTIATWVVFGFTLVFYVLQQYFAVFTTKTNRAFPGQLLLERTQVLLYIETAGGITSLYVAIYFIPIYFQFVGGDDPLMAAVRLLPFIIVAITVNLASGYFLSAIKVYMVIFVIAGIFITIGGALLTNYLRLDTSKGTIYGLCIITGFGTGLGMLTGYSIASLTTKPANAGAALSMQNVSQIGGQVIALALAGQIFKSSAIRNLRRVLTSDSDIMAAISGAQSDVLADLEPDVRQAAITAVIDAMQKAFILIPVAGGIMLCAAVLMKREKVSVSAAPAAG